MTSKGSKSRIKWEGDSNAEIRSWPGDVKSDIGLKLHSLDQQTGDFVGKPMGKGIHQLSEQDKDFWYRLLYWLNAGWIYVLHCFTKTSNKTAKRDLDKALDRIKAVKERKDSPYVDEEKEETKSA